MLKDITGIRLCGANFDRLVDILLLDPHDGKKIKPVKATLLYGRNGAGKSTLARAMMKAKGEQQDSIVQAAFLDNNSLPILLTNEEQSRIFVFNEDFVDKNIKLRESGLNTIIMLGQQAEFAEQIQAAQEELDRVRTSCDKQKEVVTEYKNTECEKAPSYYLRKMRFALQGDECWAGRDRRIKGNRQNTSVRDDTYKQFVALSPVKTRDQLVLEFHETLQELYAAEKGDATISAKVPLFNFEYDESVIANLLQKRIEKPQLSERERYLLGLIQSGKVDKLNDIITTFSDEKICRCPTCLQSVSEDYKQDLIESVQKVLSRAVEEHQAALRPYIVQEIEFDFLPFSKLTEKVDACSKLLLPLNAAIRNNNSVIQSKIDDPYTPCETRIQSISNLIRDFNAALQELEAARNEYNEKITATVPIKKRLTEINNSIAYYDIYEFYARFLASEEELRQEEGKLIELQGRYLQTKQRVEDLEARQKNVNVALNIINSNLSYIFFSNDRLKIDYQNENYVLLSNGRPVKPAQISQGERNIIGLCYFFASILANQEELSAYANEYLLVIDDPVSSFDTENRTGIMSFLRLQLGKFLLGNRDTRAVLMTHDLLTFYDSEKVIRDLLEECHNIHGGDKYIFKQYELKNQTLIQFAYNGRQEYTELMKIIYSFAQGNGEEYEIVIGNIMRQALEAFSTFQYKKGIEDISRDRDILDLLPDSVYRNYFGNRMYRLVLNNGSHRLDQTKSMSDMNFFSITSAEEKRQTAKEMLCFIYLLNKRHLLSHLVECSNAEANLLNWCSEIKASMG